MTKILEQNGVENTGLDAARFNRFCSGYRDGIIKNSYKECAINLLSSNIFQIEKGELLISGFRIISEATQFTYNSFPSVATRYQIVAQIVLLDSQPSFKYLARMITPLRQDNILADNVTSGIYEIEVARFSLETNKITDLIRTVDIITGDKCIGPVFNIGAVTTAKINIDLDTEVEINERIDEETGKHFIDFHFNLPIDLEQVKNDTATALKTSSTANLNSEKALTAAQTAENSASTASKSSDLAVQTANEAKDAAETANGTASEAKQIAKQALGKVNDSVGSIVKIGGVAVSEFDADTKADADSVPTKESDLEADRGYVTESQLAAKNYATKNDLPTDYVTEAALNDKNYATADDIPDVSGKADLNNSNQTITANDIVLQGFSMFNYCADLGSKITPIKFLSGGDISSNTYLPVIDVGQMGIVSYRSTTNTTIKLYLPSSGSYDYALILGNPYHSSGGTGVSNGISGTNTAGGSHLTDIVNNSKYTAVMVLYRRVS